MQHMVLFKGTLLLKFNTISMLFAFKDGTNHPQLKRSTYVTRMYKCKKHAWHQTMRAHGCKV